MIEVSIVKKFSNISLNFSFKTDKLKSVIFGSSGSGKSSLLKMIAGFYNPNQGFIKVNGSDFYNSQKNISMPINKRNIGYLTQEYTLFPHMSVMENIVYGLKAKNLDIEEEKIYRLAENLKIENKLNEYPANLSGGEKQRVALARAIVIKPFLLLLDEPFSALDKPVRESLREIVSDIVTQMKIPTLFVTHDIEEAFIFADDILLVDDGSIIEYGNKDDVFNNPNSVKSAEILDFKNIWKIKHNADNSVVLETNDNLICKNNAMSKFKYCCIKPENIMILREDMANKDKENKISGYIFSIHNRGDYIKVVFKSHTSSLFAEIKIPSHAVHKMDLIKGKKITISLKKESLILCN